MKSIIMKKSLAGATLLSLLAPALIFAQTTTSAVNTPNKGVNFCANVVEVTNRASAVVRSAQGAYHSDRNEKALNVVYYENQALQKKGIANAYAQSINARMYNTLNGRAKTQEQKDALANFKTIYDQASATMEAANTLALTTYKTETAKVHATRTSTINEANANYNAAVNAAIAKAKSDCAAGVDSLTAYNTYKTSLKAANSTFSVKSKMGDIKAQIKPLNEALRTSLKAAHEAFKATIKPAWAEVTALFKVVPTPDAPEGSTI